MSLLPRKKSTLAAQKYAASQRPLGEVIVAQKPQITANKGDRTWDGGPSLLIPGISAFDLPSSTKGSGGLWASEGLDTGTGRRSSSKPSNSQSAAARDAAGSKSKEKQPAPRSGAKVKAKTKTSTKASKASRYGAAAVANSRNHQDHVLVSSIVVAFVLLAMGLGFFQVRGGVVKENSKKEIVGTLTAVHSQQIAFREENQRFATWAELQDLGMKVGPRQAVVASNASISHWFMSIRDSDTGLICSRTGELFDESSSERNTSCYTP